MKNAWKAYNKSPKRWPDEVARHKRIENASSKKGCAVAIIVSGAAVGVMGLVVAILGVKGVL
jgi:hypothetical protein